MYTYLLSTTENILYATQTGQNTEHGPDFLW